METGRQGETWALTEAKHGDRFKPPAFPLTGRMVDETASDPTLRVVRAYEKSGEVTGGLQRSTGTVNG